MRELNGLPDIFAARFSGPEATYASNAELVLDLMEDVPDGLRQARFATACVWVDPRPEETGDQVLAPAHQRWLRNPWGRDLPFRGPAMSGITGILWWIGGTSGHVYRRGMEADLVSWGHDREQLAEVAHGLFAGCPDALVKGRSWTRGWSKRGSACRNA